MKRAAFTLVEVLCTITLVASLAAILFPVFSKAKAAASGGKCLSNLRHIGYASNLYLQDWDDAYPHAITEWQRSNPFLIPGYGSSLDNTAVAALPSIKEVLLPYGVPNDTWACPLDFGLPNAAEGALANPVAIQFGTSYDFTILLGGILATSIEEPSRFAYSRDVSGEWHTFSRASFNQFRFDALYYDGHVKHGAWSDTLLRAR